MLELTCTGLVRNEDLTIKGYTLTEKKNSKSKNFYTEAVIQHIKTGEITVDNISLNNDKNKILLLELDMDIIESDNKLKSFINKLRLLGADIKEITTACGNKCYLGSIDNKMHYLYIPSNVKKLTEPFSNDTYNKNVKSIRGTLTITGGQGLESTAHMFEDVILDNLVLGKLDFSNIKTMKNMFKHSKIKNITFGDINTSNVVNMNNMFSFAYLSEDMIRLINSLDTRNVRYMTEMFKYCRVEKLNLNNFKANNLVSARGMFESSVMLELDIRNLVLTNINDKTFIFTQSDIGQVLVSNTDKKTRQFKSYLKSNTPESDIKKTIVNWNNLYIKE